ncbi:DEAD/DEAH box helicase [Riemerella anatipestifer]|uniref:SNF2-related protein n=1 Tax=Riemerella anatipestifer TaxID=34085 RepID=UPI0030C52D9A
MLTKSVFTEDYKQAKAIEKLSQTKVGALFMEAGTGKTLPAYRLVETLPGCDYCLYLAPYQTIHNKLSTDNVVTEIEKYGGFSMAHDFVGIESLSNSDRIYLELLNKLQKAKKPMIICDESLKIKNSNAKRTQRIFQLGKMAGYKLILNGTPLSRNLLDLWSQMEFLSPLILGMREAEFKNTFCEYTKITKIGGGARKTREWINKYHNIDYLYSLIEPYIFESKLTLSVGRIDIPVHFEISEDCKNEYEAIKAKFLNMEEMMKWNNQIWMAMVQKLQHSYSISESKFEVLEKIIKDNPGDKILVACKFIDSQEEVAKRFGDKVKVLSYGKHTYGLNLQDYSIMVLWEKHWDYASLEQIQRRIFRKGQKKECRFFDFHSNAKLDGIMTKNLDKKGRLLDYFKNKSVQELQEIL